MSNFFGRDPVQAQAMLGLEYKVRSKRNRAEVDDPIAYKVFSRPSPPALGEETSFAGEIPEMSLHDIISEYEHESLSLD